MFKIIINNKKELIFENKISLKNLIIELNYKNIDYIYVDNEYVGQDFILEKNAKVLLLNKNDDLMIEITRHSCAHLLAHAFTELYPKSKITIGPVTKDGFYYDFYTDDKVNNKDLKNIENKMSYISNLQLDIIRIKSSKNEAEEIFNNNKYKLELIKDINEDIFLYKQGNFIDLCKGPHLPNTKDIKYFKLLRTSGAYWNNDKKNEMLQRIYGTAYTNEIDLNFNLNKLEIIKKNDHRKIGKNLDLFHFKKDNPGAIFWHNKGWSIYIEIINYIRKKFKDNNYIEVNTPTIIEPELFIKSGHLEKFDNNLFKIKTDNNMFILKPMNCPCHVEIFKSSSKSYKDFPIRYAEFGSCFRNEISGSLYGLMRLKNFTQDDGHIFCLENQINTEIVTFINLLKTVYNDFGFKKIETRLSKRPINRIGNDEIWGKAENYLEKAIELSGCDYSISNDGAFYGPKIEFLLNDCFERKWQCGTIQLDFFTGKRLNAKFTNKDGSISSPIILHRAILGSIERFIGILIEEYKGVFPFWLAPIQIAVVSINDENEYIKNIYNILNKNYRTILNVKNEKIGLKIRDCILQKIPYIVIIGDEEVKENKITFRKLNGEIRKNISLDYFIDNLNKLNSLKGDFY